MKRNFQRSNETIELGVFMHKSEETPVIKLTCENIPYPNSPVLINNKVIGKIDEILGTMDNVFANIILESKNVKIEKDCILHAYKDKFMQKNRFLPRSEVEKKKEENDKKKTTKSMKRRIEVHKTKEEATMITNMVVNIKQAITQEIKMKDITAKTIETTKEDMKKKVKTTKDLTNDMC